MKRPTALRAGTGVSLSPCLQSRRHVATGNVQISHPNLDDNRFYKDVKKIERPQLNRLDSLRMTPVRLDRTWASKIQRGSPLLLDNLPGFLDNQPWFRHPESHPDGTLAPFEPWQSSHKSPTEDSNKSTFAFLRDSIMAKVLGQDAVAVAPNGRQPVHLGRMFDELVVRFKLEGQNMMYTNADVDAPLIKFWEWLRQSRKYSRFNLEEKIEQILYQAESSDKVWEAFDAPLAFIRAALQYNDEQRNERFRITRLAGLMELEDPLTDDFPFPKVIQEFAGFRLGMSSCSIRLGIRPIRSDLRRHNETSAIGQLAGYSKAILIRPQIKSLGDKPVYYHEAFRDNKQVARALNSTNNRGRCSAHYAARLAKHYAEHDAEAYAKRRAERHAELLDDYKSYAKVYKESYAERYAERYTEHVGERDAQREAERDLDDVVRYEDELSLKVLPRSYWTKEFEKSISDGIVHATLVPGTILMVPKGWWYGVRSHNWGNDLYATVGWWLRSSPKDAADLEKEGDSKSQAPLVYLGI